MQLTVIGEAVTISVYTYTTLICKVCHKEYSKTLNTAIKFLKQRLIAQLDIFIYISIKRLSREQN